jgi:hypothetical protein
VITSAGAFSFAISLFCLIVFLHYPGLGLTHPWDALKYLAILAAAAIVVDSVASAVRGRQGMSLTNAMANIPPQ